MKLYTCSNCGQSLYFENTQCLQCGHRIGFDPHTLNLATLVPVQDDIYATVKNPSTKFRFCENALHNACNWLIPSPDESPFCIACSLNGTIPFLGKEENKVRWLRLEAAKRRLVYSLLRLKLPVRGPGMQGEPRLVFEFKEDFNDQRVITGHDNGTITINIEEADAVERTRNQVGLGEKYRTLLGHFRHETGHYYWDLLIRDTDKLEKFRELFGNEEADYTRALEAHYANGPRADWENNFITPYASSHPWEDWAESWSHYLHMMDTLETAYHYGIGVHPKKSTTPDADINIGFDPYKAKDFNTIVSMWYPLTFAVNSLNRSMGHVDFYPFVVSPEVVKKLEFIHEVCSTRTPIQKTEMSTVL